MQTTSTGTPPSIDYLLILGEATALAWVLAEQRMAFPAYRRAAAGRLNIGDELLLYTTRGCFYNPSRDMGRVMGVATVASHTVSLAEPVTLAGRAFTYGCNLCVSGVAPLHKGVELAPLVPELEVFPDTHSWSMWLRRPLLPLPAADAKLLRSKLGPLLGPLDRHLDAYLQAARRRL